CLVCGNNIKGAIKDVV
ncbi:hypothetical protein Pcinc_040227, partial [Petrolisthes cinctipes]